MLLDFDLRQSPQRDRLVKTSLLFKHLWENVIYYGTVFYYMSCSFQLNGNQLKSTKNKTHNYTKIVDAQTIFFTKNYRGKISRLVAVIQLEVESNIQVHIKKCNNCVGVRYFLAVISESEAVILKRLMTQRIIFLAFIFLFFLCNFNDYNFQVKKIQNSFPQKIWMS